MNLTPSQKDAADWMAENSGLLIATPGTGKTRTTLAMLETTGKRALIMAPASVARRTWQDEQAIVGGREIFHWHGTRTDNSRRYIRNPHIIVSYELASNYLQLFGANVDVVIFDEVTRLRNPKGKRFKAIRRQLDDAGITHRIGLTGTPVANHYHQLYGQLQITAGLPMIYEQWLTQYFIAERRMTLWQDQVTWRDGPDTASRIEEVLAPRSYKMPPACEQRRRVIDHWVSTSVPLDPETDSIVEAHQLAQGRIYDADYPEDVAESLLVHTAKQDRLAELLDDLQGEPVLIFYQFQHDKLSIKKALKNAHVKNYAMPADSNKLNDEIEPWNNRKLNALVVHPGSAGHGLNLQRGGHQIIWYGVPWDAELYEQGIGRLDRQGQTETVMVHRILTENSVDEQIVSALSVKRAKAKHLVE